jgi:cyclopropane fatty-acyl-phospholipid synthase-like methyltransferase
MATARVDRDEVFLEYTKSIWPVCKAVVDGEVNVAATGCTCASAARSTATQLVPGERLLDVASGIGTSALLLAEEYGVQITGIDLGTAQVAKAREGAD